MPVTRRVPRSCTWAPIFTFTPARQPTADAGTHRAPVSWGARERASARVASASSATTTASVRRAQATRGIRGRKTPAAIEVALGA